jgi:hypothetical protein
MHAGSNPPQPSTICLRCREPVPNHLPVIRGFWWPVPPVEEWGRHAYHEPCFRTEKAERGIPKTAWTSPPRTNPAPRCSCRAVACPPDEAELWAYGGEVPLKMDNSGCVIHQDRHTRSGESHP